MERVIHQMGMKLLGLSIGSNWYKYDKLQEEKRMVTLELMSCLGPEELETLLEFCQSKQQWILKKYKERQMKKFEDNVRRRNGRKTQQKQE